VDTELKAIRKQKGLTTTQVANELGLSQGYYSQLENGRRVFDKEQIAQLAKILGSDPTDIRSSVIRTAEDGRLMRHWLTSMPIDGMPALQAFRREYRGKGFRDAAEVRKKFESFLLRRMPSEIKRELSSDKELVELMFTSLKTK